MAINFQFEIYFTENPPSSVETLHLNPVAITGMILPSLTGKLSYESQCTIFKCVYIHYYREKSIYVTANPLSRHIYYLEFRCLPARSL